MSKDKIAIIGGGNLGISIAEGLIEAGHTLPANIIVTRRKLSLLQNLADKGVKTTDDNIWAVEQAHLVIIAVKPKQIADVLKELSPSLKKHHTLVSVVTGVSIDEIQHHAGHKATIMRAMPNTAIAIRESMTCVAYNEAPLDKVEQVTQLFDQLGKTVVINEELMEAATVLGACGIAYALRFIRAATQGGIEIGFDSNTASLIAAQTAKGAAALLIQNGQHPEREIDKVTTPQGCTIVGLNEMEHQGFSSALIRGILASFRKIAK
jgi:pyrroline-5-carboxylate reductase